jgi:hypothetical protein
MTTESLERQVEGAWTELEHRLADWLTDVPPDGHLVIELAWPDEDESKAAPYVQLAIDGLAVRSEAVSNHYLASRFRLDDARVETLLEAGWDKPDEDDGGLNYWREDQVSVDAELVAEALVTALRDVYGVPDPSFLVASGSGADGRWGADDLPLGIRVREPEQRQIDLTAVVAGSPDELRDLVAGAVASVTIGDVEFDPDGDIPVPAGDVTFYVSVDEESPAVRLWAVLLHDVPWKPRVGFELNRANNHLRYARLQLQNGLVVLEYQMYCRPFVPQLLRAAVSAMSGLVEGMDARLQVLIGGRLMSDMADGAA